MTECLEKSLHLYTRLLGMKVLRQKDYPAGKFSNTFVGYGADDTDAVIELACNSEQQAP